VRDPRFEIYEATDGWRWRLIAANGRILASGEAFASKRNALRAVDAVIDTVPSAAHMPIETADERPHRAS
jgi:uncharacterized protein YegP (UPF0339 family)